MIGQEGQPSGLNVVSEAVQFGARVVVDVHVLVLRHGKHVLVVQVSASCVQSRGMSVRFYGQAFTEARRLRIKRGVSTPNLGLA